MDAGKLGAVLHEMIDKLAWRDEVTRDAAHTAVDEATAEAKPKAEPKPKAKA